MDAVNIELTIIEDLLNDECKCESLTHKEVYTVCSVEVTHRVLTACGMGNRLLCKIATATLQGFIASGSISCAYCGRCSEDCWSIRPV